MLINMNSDYDNLKLNEKSSYLTKFSCSFDRFQYIRLSFGAVTTGNMFQKKTDELPSRMPNVFSIADDSLTEGFDGRGKE